MLVIMVAVVVVMMMVVVVVVVAAAAAVSRDPDYTSDADPEIRSGSRPTCLPCTKS